MTKELTNYQAMNEELNAWSVEAKFDMTMVGLKWAHAYAEIVRRHHKGELTEPLVENLMRNTQKSRDTIFRWVRLYDKYPNLEAELEKRGKNISMNMLIGAPKKEKVEKEDECRHCATHGCPPPRKSLMSTKI